MNLSVVLRRVFTTFAILLAIVSNAAAHASLNASSPADGALVPEVPRTLSLTFSEPVSPLRLRLIAPDGSGQDLADWTLLDQTLEIVSPDGLMRGTHVLSWRVVSSDGHPVGGSVVFSVGEASTSPPTVEDRGDPIVTSLLWVSKIGVYLGLFGGVGGVVAQVLLMPGTRSGRSMIWALICLGAFSTVVSLGLQGLDALGSSLPSLSSALSWETGFSTSYGPSVVAALSALLLASLAMTAHGWRNRLLAGMAGTSASVALALTGHASAASPQWLMRSAVFLHALAVLAWVGPLVPLALALRNKEPASVPGLRRFSSIIPFSLVLLFAAGSILAVVQVETPDALLDTAYGRILLAKLGLVASLLLLAAFNRWRLTERAAAEDVTASRKLVRLIGVETAIIVLIFAAIAGWRFTPPPRALHEAAAAPASVHIHTDKAMADLTVTPGRSGTVSASAMIMTGDLGALDAKEVTFVFANPTVGIEPFRRQAKKPGDGTWRADNIILPSAGTWSVRIDILISDFEVARLNGEINIRP